MYIPTEVHICPGNWSYPDPNPEKEPLSLKGQIRTLKRNGFDKHYLHGYAA
jgi:hypothetical protein